MNKKLLTISGVIVVVVAITFIILSGRNDNDSRDITLGLMLPLTGDYAAAGQNMQKGMELAIDEFRNNNPDMVINVVIEDDAYDAAKGTSAYKKMVSLDKVDMILMLSTPVIDAIHDDAVSRGIPIIQLGVQTVGVGDDNIIQFSPSAESPIGYLANYLNEDYDFYSKKVAVVYDNSLAQLSFFKVFEKQFQHEITPFVVNSKDDLRGYATKIVNDDYESVVIITSPENGAILSKEILTFGNEVPMLAFDAQLQTGFADYERILGDVSRIDGSKSMWFKSGKMDVLSSLYEERYGEKPGFLVDFSYDMINTALATYDENQEVWVSNLKEFNDPNGASGSISFDNNGIRIQPMVITEIREGKLVPVD